MGRTTYQRQRGADELSAPWPGPSRTENLSCSAKKERCTRTPRTRTISSKEMKVKKDQEGEDQVLPQERARRGHRVHQGQRVLQLRRPPQRALRQLHQGHRRQEPQARRTHRRPRATMTRAGSTPNGTRPTKTRPPTAPSGEARRKALDHPKAKPNGEGQPTTS